MNRTVKQIRLAIKDIWYNLYSCFTHRAIRICVQMQTLTQLQEKLQVWQIIHAQKDCLTP